jgi:hypothetical protein
LLRLPLWCRYPDTALKPIWDGEQIVSERARDRMHTDALSKRITYFKKAFGKGLGHKPSTLQSAAILRAATLTAKAELAAADPGTTLNDLVRVDAAAARARRDMEQATRASKERPEPTLDQYLAPKQHAAA